MSEAADGPGAASVLWGGLAHHLAVEAILAGDLPGTVILDDPRRRSAGLLIGANAYRVHLAGTARDEGFNRRVSEHLLERRAAGQRELVIYHDGGEWSQSVTVLVPGATTTALPRCHLRLDTGVAGDRAAWRSHAAGERGDFRVRRITGALLREGLRHTDDLMEELCSESPSVERFLEREFGFCVQEDEAIVGFCTTEYTRPGRCELGVNTVAAYRRRGVATLAAAAVIEEAHRRGITEVGWDCWANNAASLALARKLGFLRVADYSVWLCVWPEE